MDTLVRLAGVTLVGCIAAFSLRKNAPVIGLLTALAAGLLLLFEAARFFSPLTQLIVKLQSLTGVNSGLFSPLIKVVVISVASRILSEFCRDASQDALAQTVELAALVLSLAVSAPLFLTLFEYVERLI